MILRRHLPPLRLLTAFETVVRAGGVQTAAAELNVTQPAVSQALRNLEDHIGTKLLDRRMRPAALTDAGRVLLHAVSDGMDRIESAIGKIRALERNEQNVVTIACTVCTGTYWLMPRLATFYTRHPDIVVRVVPTSGTRGLRPKPTCLFVMGQATGLMANANRFSMSAWFQSAAQRLLNMPALEISRKLPFSMLKPTRNFHPAGTNISTRPVYRTTGKAISRSATTFKRPRLR